MLEYELTSIDRLIEACGSSTADMALDETMKTTAQKGAFMTRERNGLDIQVLIRKGRKRLPLHKVSEASLSEAVEYGDIGGDFNVIVAIKGLLCPAFAVNALMGGKSA